MYYCKKCGKEIPDDAMYCPYCGANQQEENDRPTIDDIKEDTSEHVTTFKEASRNIFLNCFKFDGRQKRREFNYQILFMIIISILFSIVLSIITIGYTVSVNPFIEESVEKVQEFIESNLFVPYLIFNIIMAIIFMVFMIAPIYRRFNDTNSPALRYFGVLAIIVHAFSISNVDVLFTSTVAKFIISVLDLSAFVLIICAMVLPSRDE